MPRALLVYNPVAGRYPSRLLTERAARILQSRGWQIEIATTKSGEHINTLALQAVEDDLEAFIVVGGDGSINRALPGLIGTQTALGVLPAGTANVWAQELGLPGLSWTRLTALEESARRLANAEVRSVDVGVCNKVPFLLWAGVGLDAFVVHRIEPRNQWEKPFAVLYYGAKAVWEAGQWHGIELSILDGERELSGQYMLGVVSNIRLYAGGYLKLSPKAQMDDGQMDLWLFEGSTLEDTLLQAWNLLSGRHVQSERVRCIPFQKISLRSSSALSIQIDGEPEQGSEQIDIEVIPQALRILVPEKAPQSLYLKSATTNLE
jgi:YegS/Rv2252/BmrU family lipid kinase